MRCFKCQKFGHHESDCKNTKVCGKCSSKDDNHNEFSCTIIKCANCGKDHPAFSNQCEIWKKEKDIIRIKTVNKITYPEARKILDSPTKSYASIIKQTSKSVTMKDAQTQTESVSCTANAATSITAPNQSTSKRQEKPNKPTMNTGPPSGRQQKGSKDPVRLNNKFSTLTGDDDMDCSSSEPSRSKSPKKKARSPVKAPK